ncbi:unnamed protein product [Amoebophrya sp. A25]|nr:unnamed protein product [Amoebophrya sp. A25]|eukprot:GSA25T00016807001.1
MLRRVRTSSFIQYSFVLFTSACEHFFFHSDRFWTGLHRSVTRLRERVTYAMVPQD